MSNGTDQGRNPGVGAGVVGVRKMSSNKIIDGLQDAIAHARGEPNRARETVVPVADGPVPPRRVEGSSRLVHVPHEFYLGGIRFAAGTYKITSTAIKPGDANRF